VRSHGVALVFPFFFHGDQETCAGFQWELRRSRAVSVLVTVPVDTVSVLVSVPVDTVLVSVPVDTVSVLVSVPVDTVSVFGNHCAKPGQNSRGVAPYRAYYL